MRVDESQQQFQAELDQIQARLHRGRLGLLVGAVLGVAAAIGLGLAIGFESTSLLDLATVFTLGCFGAALGHLITVGRLEPRINDVVGFDIAADRIRRTVRGEEHSELSPEQQQRAARYAALIVLISPAQALRWTLLVAGIFTVQLARLIGAAVEVGQPVATLVPAGIGVFGAVVLAALIPSRLRAARHARTYSHTHPWHDPQPSATTGTEDA